MLQEWLHWVTVFTPHLLWARPPWGGYLWAQVSLWSIREASSPAYVPLCGWASRGGQAGWERKRATQSRRHLGLDLKSREPRKEDSPGKRCWVWPGHRPWSLRDRRLLHGHPGRGEPWILEVGVTWVILEPCLQCDRCVWHRQGPSLTPLPNQHCWAPAGFSTRGPPPLGYGLVPPIRSAVTLD